MAIDTSLYGRLQRLFGTSVIIRNVGGNQLKAIDLDNVQSYGNKQSNGLMDKYGRIHSVHYASLYDYPSNYSTLKPQLYRDYETMDTDAIISSALDVLADECTLKNENREILQIRSSDDKIQSILYNLFYDILNIEYTLWPWIRNMCKYGDHYVYLRIKEGYGIYNVLPMPPHDINRHEGENPEKPDEVFFTLGPDGQGSGVQYNRDLKNRYENFEIAHFRLLSDTRYLPYGRAYIEPARKIYKQLSLMEEAMMIHRIMRAPEKRVFYINIGAIPPNEVEQFMKKTVDKMKKTPFVDPQTGEYNLKYNMMNALEDYYIPVRGGDATTRIDTAKGLEYNAIEDVNYLRDKLLASLKIPKAFFGYEKDLNGKCIHPDTNISLLNGSVKTIKEIAELFENDKNVDLWTYSYDFVENRVVPGKIVTAQKTRLNAQLVRVHIDNGTYVDTTPDHGFILEDGTRIDAQDLKSGDSLRTINKKLKNIKGKKTSTYEQVYQPNTKSWEWTHKMVSSYFSGSIENNGRTEDGKFDQNKLIVIHHKDFNRYNNNPSNLERLTWKDHYDIHSKNSKMTIFSEESIKKAIETKQTDEYRKKASEARSKFLNENQEHKYTLVNSWMARTHEERKSIIRSGLSKERSEKIIKNNRERNSYIKLAEGYAKKFPNGRPDLQKNNSVRYIDRPNYDFIKNVAIENKNNIRTLKDLSNLCKYDCRIIKEVINNNDYTVNEFLNEYIGFCTGRPKNLKLNRIIEIANGCKDENHFYSISGYTKKSLKRLIGDYKKFLNEHLGVYFNHKVLFVEWLEDRVDTYNMEVYDYNENHNYLLFNDIVIKNSTLAAEDIRFGRTIQRLQSIVVSELTRIALIHLYVQGYTDERLTNFELGLTTPSIIYEQEKIALWKEKVSLAQDLVASNLVSSDWIYDKIFEFSEDQVSEMRDLIAEDKKRIFRLTQIENEGNDPSESGESYGTPHDLASLYGRDRLKDGGLPDGFDETKVVGRPKEKSSIYGTQDSAFGRDAIGKKEMNAPMDTNPLRHNFRGGSPLSLKEIKEINIFLGKGSKENENNLLSESNIKDL